MDTNFKTETIEDIVQTLKEILSFNRITSYRVVKKHDSLEIVSSINNTQSMSELLDILESLEQKRISYEVCGKFNIQIIL